MRELLERLEVFVESRAIDLPDGYRGWRLYSPGSSEEKKVVDRAVKDLNAATRKAAWELKGWMKRHPSIDFKGPGAGPELSRVWKKHIKPVLSKDEYKSSGVAESETMYIVAQLLVDFVKDYYGFSGWTKLGDYIH